eukprot:1157368-Pelagomonas_calceolata.AAC.3
MQSGCCMPEPVSLTPSATGRVIQGRTMQTGLVGSSEDRLQGPSPMCIHTLTPESATMDILGLSSTKRSRYLEAAQSM